MKKLIFVFLLTISYFNSIGQSNTTNLASICCSEERGCTGSIYCSACKNCSGCKHCAKNGGSCGVCSRGTKVKYNSSSNTQQKAKANTYTKISDKLIKGEFLYVNIASLNLREGPDVNYRIIEKLSKNSKLIYLDKDKSWIKVKVDKSGLIGFVYFKYLY